MTLMTVFNNILQWLNKNIRVFYFAILEDLILITHRMIEVGETDGALVRHSVLDALPELFGQPIGDVRIQFSVLRVARLVDRGHLGGGQRRQLFHVDVL